MREIRHIIIHCTDTPAGREVSGEEIDSWHRQRGYTMIGYHYVVHLDGWIEAGRPLFMKGAHCKAGGGNNHSIGICYVGGRNTQGFTADTRTPQQRAALKVLIGYLKQRYPQAQVSGHRDWDKGRACPCFDAKAEYMQHATCNMQREE